MPITNLDIAQAAQWDALVAILRAETQPGKRLAGINYVGRVLTLWTDNPPTIGVQQGESVIVPGPSMQREMVTPYEILIGAQSTNESASTNMAPGVKANPEDAMNQVQKLLADRAGNGLLAVLCDPANYSLGGYAYKMYPQKITFDSEVRPGTEPQMWAYGLVTAIAYQRVWIQGS